MGQVGPDPVKGCSRALTRRRGPGSQSAADSWRALGKSLGFFELPFHSAAVKWGQSCPLYEPVVRNALHGRARVSASKNLDVPYARESIVSTLKGSFHNRFQGRRGTSVRAYSEFRTGVGTFPRLPPLHSHEAP